MASDDNDPTVPVSNILASISAGTHLSTDIPTVPLDDNDESLADQWSSASDDDSNPLNGLADEWSLASDTERDLADEWSLASGTGESPTSSLPTINSQIAVSPTRITINHSLDALELSHD